MPLHDYNSGHDYVLEYGDLQYLFGEQDFLERCEAAARMLELVAKRDLSRPEQLDLVYLVMEGGPPPWSSAESELGRHLCDEWNGGIGRPGDTGTPIVVHWMRRLVFRGAWVDQAIKEGDIEPRLRPGGTFEYVNAETREPLEFQPNPSLARSMYTGADIE